MSCCEWALVNEQMKKYHDEEWGIPVYDDDKFFELLIFGGDAGRTKLGYYSF